MLQNLERLILDPRSEAVGNAPIELTGRDEGHGIYLVSHAYPRAERKTLYAASIDSPGERRVNAALKSNRRVPITVWIAEEFSVPGATNLAPNPSIEIDTAEWADFNAATISRGDARSKFGEFALRVDTTAAATVGGRTELIELTNDGAVVYVLAWVWAPNGAPIRLRLQEYDGAGVQINATAATADLTGNADWQMVTLSADFTAAGANARVVFQQQDATARVFWVDGLVVSETEPLVYFDGDTPGCYWDGTISASRSVRREADGARFQGAQFDLEMKLEKLAREGGTMKRYLPSGDPITFDIEEVEGPDPQTIKAISQGRDEVSFELVCGPYPRGEEVAGVKQAEATLPVVTRLDTALVKGTAGARGRLVIEDDQGVDRLFCAWGVQSRYLDRSNDAALFYEAETRTPLNGAVTASRAGASGGGSNTIRSATTSGEYAAIMSTQASGGGNHLAHVGTYRVFARVLDTWGHKLALEWGDGDYLNVRRNAEKSPHFDEWTILDLGLVRLAPQASGTKRWEARLLARSNDLTAQSNKIFVDWIAFVPVDEGSGICAVTPQLVAPTSFTAREEFEQSAGALAGKVAPVGGTWAGAGDPDGFAIDAPLDRAFRSAVSDAEYRFELLGSGAGVAVATLPGMFTTRSTGEVRIGVVARYSSTTSFVAMYVKQALASGVNTLVVEKQAGVGAANTTILGSKSYGAKGFPQGTLVLVCTAGGRWEVYSQVGSTFLLLLSGIDSDLATGGSHASGQTGLCALNSSSVAHTVFVHDFEVWTPSAAVPAIPANKELQVRHDRIVREAAAGQLLDFTDYEGDYLALLPASGGERRDLRYIVIPSRSNPRVGGDSNIDDTAAQMFVTPLYDTVPEPS